MTSFEILFYKVEEYTMKGVIGRNFVFRLGVMSCRRIKNFKKICISEKGKNNHL